jgi:hypothetical protein
VSPASRNRLEALIADRSTPSKVVWRAEIVLATADWCGTNEYCARCKRRNVVSYQVPEEIKRLVLLGRWRSDVCPSCFDELAERVRIRYRFEDVSAVSWSDMPAPRARPRGKR